MSDPTTSPTPAPQPPPTPAPQPAPTPAPQLAPSAETAIAEPAGPPDTELTTEAPPDAQEAPEEAPAAKPVPKAKGTPPYKGKVTFAPAPYTQVLAVRVEPNSNSQILARLPEGSIVTVVKISGNWGAFKKGGWGSLSYIKPLE